MAKTTVEIPMNGWLNWKHIKKIWANSSCLDSLRSKFRRLCCYIIAALCHSVELQNWLEYLSAI